MCQTLWRPSGHQFSGLKQTQQFLAFALCRLLIPCKWEKYFSQNIKKLNQQLRSNSYLSSRIIVVLWSRLAIRKRSTAVFKPRTEPEVCILVFGAQSLPTLSWKALVLPVEHLKDFYSLIKSPQYAPKKRHLTYVCPLWLTIKEFLNSLILLTSY